MNNVRFISRIYGQDFERNLDFVESFAELGPYLREPVRSYSAGMRARLAFAISMIIEFDCFLIDEIAAVVREASIQGGRRQLVVWLVEGRQAPRMVSTCAPRRPITLPNRPAAIEPTSGARGTASSELRESSDMVGISPDQPLRVSRSLTLIARRLRKTSTRMARPMADSAAATVRMKKTKT